jgi:hypothetical protein
MGYNWECDGVTKRKRKLGGSVHAVREREELKWWGRCGGIFKGSIEDL